MVFNKVVEVMVDVANVDPDKVTMDSDLASDLELDSLDAVEIVMALEDEYGLELPDEDIEKFKTVGDIVEYVEKLLD